MRRDVTRTEGIAVIQMSIERGFGNSQRVAFVTNRHFFPLVFFFFFFFFFLLLLLLGRVIALVLAWVLVLVWFLGFLLLFDLVLSFVVAACLFFLLLLLGFLVRFIFGDGVEGGAKEAAGEEDCPTDPSVLRFHRGLGLRGTTNWSELATLQLLLGQAIKKWSLDEAGHIWTIGSKNYPEASAQGSVTRRAGGGGRGVRGRARRVRSRPKRGGCPGRGR